MEYIPGYDAWKTAPLDDPDPEAYCAQCGVPLYPGDLIYTIDGGICEDCLECSYKDIV